MRAKHYKRRGLSTVLTTMIILVASVVLATGVAVFGTSLFQTGAQQQSIAVQGTVMWVDPTDDAGLAWGATGVRNNGDKLVSVDKIIVRGTTVPFTNWYVDSSQTRVSTANFQSQFQNNGTDTSDIIFDNVDQTPPGTVTTPCTTPDGTTIELDLDWDGPKDTLCLEQASGPTSLQPGQRMIVYFKVPNGIVTPVDSGAATSIGIFAGQAGAPVSIIIAEPNT
ncbi:MAG: hypothetical protein IH948_06935 [Bacteroidetes bacterium]|nr:hypothetical protein [Bacteroidota bacterium]